MSLGRKLMGGFGAMLVLVLVTSGGALLLTRSLNKDLKQAAQVTARRQYLAGLVNAATSEMASLERGAVLAQMLSDSTRAAEYRQRFGKMAATLQKNLDDLQQNSDAQGATLLQTLKQKSSQVIQGHDKVSQAMTSQQMDVA